jgi:hypothetical protein
MSGSVLKPTVPLAEPSRPTIGKATAAVIQRTSARANLINFYEQSFKRSMKFDGV